MWKILLLCLLITDFVKCQKDPISLYSAVMSEEFRDTLKETNILNIKIRDELTIFIDNFNQEINMKNNILQKEETCTDLEEKIRNNLKKTDITVKCSDEQKASSTKLCEDTIIESQRCGTVTLHDLDVLKVKVNELTAMNKEFLIKIEEHTKHCLEDLTINDETSRCVLEILMADLDKLETIKERMNLYISTVKQIEKDYKKCVSLALDNMESGVKNIATTVNNC